ncbi:MAG: major facilitator superfamily 1 [Bacteroidetes bacterium]|nr:major facilitator superfamily 1 [Bacteroidota bacterium]
MPDLKKTDAYAALRIPEYRAYLFARSLSTIGLLMQNTVLAWQIYEITHNKLALGLIGLSEAVPFILTTFVSGIAADRYNRKRILLVFTLFLVFCAAILSVGSWQIANKVTVLWFYAIIGLVGICRSFLTPASAAIQSRVVPRELYANSSTWSSNSFQVSAVTGPVVAGLLLEVIAPHWVYLICAVIFLISLYYTAKLDEHYPPPMQEKEPFVRSFFGGIRFVFGTQAILSSITLDLFAVLFGGVTGLIPAFCKDVLHTGPTMMGLLKAALFLGSAVAGFGLAHHPPTKNAGRNLLICVGAYGACIIGFALSPYYWLSFAMLFMAGGFDNVSVIIRGTIIQIFTPDEMRGRVAAVNSIFIKSSNEIGDFESGLAASYLGLVPGVILGGVMTLLVVGGTAIFAPALRKMKL